MWGRKFQALIILREGLGLARAIMDANCGKIKGKIKGLLEIKG